MKLIGHLLQHAGQVHLLFCQGQVGQAEPGDVKKFIDQVLQTLSLVQGDAGVFGPQLLGDLGLVPEEGEVANDTGERGLEVVGQVDNQVVFPLLCLLSGPGVRRARRRTWFSSYSVCAKSSGSRMGSSLG